MTQTLWARKFYEIATHYVCAKNPQAAYLHEARLLSRLCVERYTTRSSTGSISRFERAWTSYTCFRDRGTSPADFALVGPPVILDTTLKACDGGFSFFLFFCCGVDGSVGTLLPISVWLDSEMDFFCLAGNVILQQSHPINNFTISILEYENWPPKIGTRLVAFRVSYHVILVITV